MKKYLSIIVTLAVSLIFAVPAHAVLVGYWDFNEGLGLVAHDSSTFGNDGDLESAGPGWVAGKYGFGLEFDGNPDGRVVVPDSNSLDLTNSFTIMAWVKPSDFDNNKTPEVVVSKYTHPNPMIFNLKTANNSSGFWEFDATQSNLRSQTAVQSDEWQHLAVTYDGSTMSLFLNDILEGAVAATGNLDTDNNPVIIGGQNCTSNCRVPFRGIIDEVRIYNNALTQDEIVSDMSYNSAVPEPATVLLFSTGVLGLLFRKRFWMA